MSFQHKSIEEYFATLYIQSCSESQEVHKMIIGGCPTVPEVSNVFNFLTGIRPKLYSEISKEMMEIMGNDEIACKYTN